MRKWGSCSCGHGILPPREHPLSSLVTPEPTVILSSLSLFRELVFSAAKSEMSLLHPVTPDMGSGSRVPSGYLLRRGSDVSRRLLARALSPGHPLAERMGY